jgi:hypothetical protein
MRATSAGVPSRPVGWRPVSAARRSSPIHPVSTGPGFTTLARMPCAPSSRAAGSTILSSAPFEAPYGRLWAVWSLVRATIAPPPCA